MQKLISLLVLALLLSGCTGQGWDIYTNEKFSVSYPAGEIEQTAGNEVFKVSDGLCQLTVTKLSDQPSFEAFVNYIKDFYRNTEGVTLASEKVNSSSAEFRVLADAEGNSYEGQIKMIPCGERTVYITMFGCVEGWYDQEKADRALGSVQCK
ncbi:hypothetical protein GF412_03120 [Candidatus Micrarchaeota archaeon]|nr:hypothetical protein [Candidatus Micrarchaeota archaeon]MBD3417944.1 hypothetical protein [Candidatus Micrarchaeota archaeon]